MERYQRVDLLAFRARRTRRLLPNALLVLTTTLLVAAAVFPFTQRQTTAYDIIAALRYFSNYRFAERSVDYFELEAGSTPFSISGRRRQLAAKDDREPKRIASLTSARVVPSCTNQTTPRRTLRDVPAESAVCASRTSDKKACSP